MANQLGTNTLCLTLRDLIKKNHSNSFRSYAIADIDNLFSKRTLFPKPDELNKSIYSYYNIINVHSLDINLFYAIEFANGIRIYSDYIQYPSFDKIQEQNIADLLPYLPDVRFKSGGGFALYINNEEQPAGIAEWSNLSFDSHYNFINYYTYNEVDGYVGNVIDGENGGHIDDASNGIPSGIGLQKGTNKLCIILQGKLINGLLAYLSENPENPFLAKRLSPASECDSSVYSSYIFSRLKLFDGNDSYLDGILFPNGLSFYCSPRESGTSFNIATVMRCFIDFLPYLPDVRFKSGGGFALYINNEEQPAGVTRWNGRDLNSSSYNFTQHYTLPYYDISVGDQSGRDGGDIDSSNFRRSTRDTGNGGDDGGSSDKNGGGFDKNWLIKRNVKPIAISIHTPQSFKSANGSDIVCAPTFATMISRSSNSKAEVVLNGTTGSIEVTASRNIIAKADGTVTIKGSTIFLN